MNKYNRKYVKGEVNPQPYLNRRVRLGAEDRSRTYTPVKEADFESAASTIPPLRHRRVNAFDCTRTAAISQAVQAYVQKRWPEVLEEKHLPPSDAVSYNSRAR